MVMLLNDLPVFDVGSTSDTCGMHGIYRPKESLMILAKLYLGPVSADLEAGVTLHDDLKFELHV
jgi:hypothetical protein